MRLTLEKRRKAMNLEFGIKKWAAWAPGLECIEHWQSWAAGERAMSPDGVPELKAMAPMLRRRLDRIGRIALFTAWECLGEDRDIPMVFASRTGETPRSVRLLQQMTGGESLSPTDFALSVHNAIGGLFTIARQDTANCTAMAAGIETLPHALVEAALLLQDAPQVLLILSEDTLPEAFAAFADEEEATFAFSLLLEKATPGKPHFRLNLTTQDAPATGTTEMPWGLQLIRLLASDNTRLELQGARRHWCLDKIDHAH